MSQAVAEVYAKYVPNVRADRKLINYWTNAINKGDKTISDFMVYLSKNNDYLNHVKLMFTDMYYDHFASAGEEDVPESNALFESMLSINRDNLLNDQDIWYFITGLSAFGAVYTDIIIKLFKSINDREPIVQEIEDYIRKFRTDRTYNMDLLRQEISRAKEDADGAWDDSDSDNNFAVPSNMSMNMNRNMNMNDNDIYNDTSGPSASASASGNGSGNGNGSRPRLIPMDTSTAVDFEIIQKYEEIFGRNMNVREYVLYINDMRQKRRESGTALSDYIEDIYRSQGAHFGVAKDTMHMFLEKYLTEEAFIAQCLPRVHADTNYLTILRKEIIGSQEYKDKMIGKLQDIYSGMYGEEMAVADADFFFERIRANELALTSDTLTERVAEFKVETDELLQSIFDVFFDVVDREPDATEQQGYMAIVRRMSDTSKSSIDERIGVELKESLEFHDILKRKIAKAYAKHNRDTLYPSKLFTILQKILPSRLLSTIDGVIERAVQDLGDS